MAESKKIQEARALREETAAEQPPKGAGPEERRVYEEIADEAASTYSEIVAEEEEK